MSALHDPGPVDVRFATDFFRRLRSNVLLAGAAAVAFLVTVVALAGPALAPHDPMQADLSLSLAAPCRQYPMGNDALGRCLLSRIIVGTRISMALGTAVVVFSCLSGVAVGLVSGYHGGLVDELLMRVTDIFLSLPEMVAAMAIAGLMGPGTGNLLLALSLTAWMRYARLVRGITLSVRGRSYVRAAQFAGVRTWCILWRHILPACFPQVIVLATVGLAKAVLAISALGFLGFGIQPPAPEWGALLLEGRNYLLTAPHLSLYPGMVIMLCVLSFNILGDALRDSLDAGD